MTNLHKTLEGIDEKIGAKSQNLCCGIKNKNPSKKHHVHARNAHGDQFPRNMRAVLSVMKKYTYQR